MAVSLDRWLDVREPVAAALRLQATRRTEAAVERRVTELLGLAGLEAYGDVPVEQLSTGTRRLVELVAVVGFRPRVLLLDEPTAGVAQREAESVAETIESFRRDLGISMILVEHDVPMVAQLADRLVCLHQGAVLEEGPSDLVLNSEAVLEAYLGTQPHDADRLTPSPAPARMF